MIVVLLLLGAAGWVAFAATLGALRTERDQEAARERRVLAACAAADNERRAREAAEVETERLRGLVLVHRERLFDRARPPRGQA